MTDQAAHYGVPPMLSIDALRKVIEGFEFNSVLDIGAGKGQHSQIFVNFGKAVTAINAYDGDLFDRSLRNELNFIVGDYLECDFEQKFDLIWASHILEHQKNIGDFLKKIWGDLKDNGILAITVPPAEVAAGGGHINYFSDGHLLYHLAANGFDLREARVKTYGYNLSVICRKFSDFSLHTSYAPNLQELAHLLPDYVNHAIEDYKKANWHADEGWGDERIPPGLAYCWD